MAQVVLSLAAGFIISYICNLPNKFYNYLGKITNIVLIFLLFIMGIQVGINKEVMANLPTLGWKSIVLASGAILGSLGLVILTEKIIATVRSEEREINQ